MAQLAKNFPPKCKDLGSVPGTHMERLGMVACPCDFSVDWMKTSGSGAQWPSSLMHLVSSSSVRDPVPKHKVGGTRGTTTEVVL